MIREFFSSRPQELLGTVADREGSDTSGPLYQGPVVVDPNPQRAVEVRRRVTHGWVLLGLALLGAFIAEFLRAVPGKQRGFRVGLSALLGGLVVFVVDLQGSLLIAVICVFFVVLQRAWPNDPRGGTATQALLTVVGHHCRRGHTETHGPRSSDKDRQVNDSQGPTQM